jgi:hypothetical protein
MSESTQQSRPIATVAILVIIAILEIYLFYVAPRGWD